MLKKMMLAAGLVLASQLASATPIKWALNGVTFNDNTGAAGSFVYDADSNTFSAWDITTESGVLSGFNYTVANTDIGTTGGGAIANADASGILLLSVGSGRYINLNFLSDMTNAGGTIGLDTSAYGGTFQTASWECNNCGTVRWASAGSITAVSVPEPATMALLGLGLVAFGLSRRRRI